MGRMTTSPPPETDRAGANTAEPPRSAVPLDTFANRLMLVRAHAGNITIKKAAELCGLNYGSWSNWERGSKPQDIIDVVERISDGLGIDAQWLMFGGPLAEPEARSRRARWSTIRPVHARPDRLATHEYGPMAERVTEKVTLSGHGPGSRKPRDSRPKGRPDRAVPAPTLRRPVRIGSAAAPE